MLWTQEDHEEKDKRETTRQNIHNIQCFFEADLNEAEKEAQRKEEEENARRKEAEEEEKEPE